jgi:hypothetical protein
MRKKIASVKGRSQYNNTPYIAKSLLLIPVAGFFVSMGLVN